jgi:uncharacterized protein (TIGR03663 family)
LARGVGPGAPPPLSLAVFVTLLLAAGFGALAFRVPRLDLRPMHCDEAVHAVKAGIFLDTGVYRYNPREFHGPTLYYFSLPFIWLSGARKFAEIGSEVPLRLAPALFGAGVVFLLFLFGDGLGRRAAVCAGVLTAVSPAMVFYSRYYIQEILLVFFTFAAIAAGWRYTRSRRLGWALLAGACLGFMHATKETCVIAYGSILGAAVLTVVWTRWRDGHALNVRSYLHRWHMAGALKAAVVVSVVCLTAFLSNPRATVDVTTTYLHYLVRAGAAKDATVDSAHFHDHPWRYYLQLLLYAKYRAGPVWSEAAVLILAVVGITRALRRRKGACEANVHLLRFVAFYTILMTIVYAAIPYKTPWCLLGFFHGMILLAGAGFVAILRRLRGAPARGVAWALFAAAAGHLALQAYRGSFIYYADARNPYVYAHTSTDFLRLAQRIEDVARLHPDGRRMLVKVMSLEYWPLPWSLRRFERVGYWSAPQEDADAPVIVAWPEFETELDAHLSQKYEKEIYGLRPQVFLHLYIQSDLWDRFIRTRE